MGIFPVGLVFTHPLDMHKPCPRNFTHHACTRITCSALDLNAALSFWKALICCICSVTLLRSTSAAWLHSASLTGACSSPSKQNQPISPIHACFKLCWCIQLGSLEQCRTNRNEAPDAYAAILS